VKAPKDYIVFPLDLPDAQRAMDYVARLRDHVGLFKVGLELFVSEGPAILESIRDAGEAGVFLDLKLHDIPATVNRALLAASRYGPDLITVHCDQGEKTLKSFSDQNPGKTRVLGVTLLTSLTRDHLVALGYPPGSVEDLTQVVLTRARIAREAGCHGVVCSGREVGRIKSEFGPDFIAVTPGIRPAWAAVGEDDQRRVVTPAEAVRNGADYIVIGRPIRDASDPREAARQTAEEIEAIL